jgi:signal transduction histidine kinase
VRTLSTQLKDQVRKFAPSVTDITLIGPDGRVVATTAEAAPETADFSKYSFFRTVREDRTSRLQVGQPLLDPLTKTTIVPAVQRLDAADGGFQGMVMFSLEPNLLTALHREVDLGKTGSLKIIGTDGVILAGYTFPGGQEAQTVGVFANAERAFADSQFAPAGSYIAKSPVDGIDRIYYWRRLPDLPLVALVGIGVREAMAAANWQAILLGGLGVAAVGLLLTMASMLLQEFSRGIRHAISLDRQRQLLRHANSKLAAAKAHAEEANKSKSAFLAHASHELRTPLNAILGFAEIIRDQLFGDDPRRYARYAADIHHAGTHLLNVVRGLLDLTKIEAGKFELFEAFEKLDGIVFDSVQVVRAPAQKRSIALTSTPVPAEISVFADGTALRQILINLLSNAIKFTPEGGAVSISASLDNDCLVLTVDDTGVGMTEKEIEQALEPFGQIHSPLSARSEGAGLGLPLAAQLIELHGGSLRIESRPGNGTVASIRLPAWRVQVSGTAVTHAAIEI